MAYETRKKGGLAVSRIKLTLACGRYDRTMPLLEGRVVPEGLELNYLPMAPEEIFWRMEIHHEFDASEFSLGNYSILTSRGDRQFVAIPIFPSRFFRHSSIFINVRSGIQRPEGLRGKRIGTPDYTMTANIWIRGFLQHDYGVRFSDLQWFTGGLNQPGRKPRIAVKQKEGLSISDIGENTLSNMLDCGEIDAVIGAREPDCYLKESPNISRLWPDYRVVEEDYFRRTGIFPIMHIVVIRRDIYEQHRWVAQSLYKAFLQSKEICGQEMLNRTTLRYMLPWVNEEIENTAKLMGKDFWPYGLEPNRKLLETFISYALEQGLLESAIKTEDLFAKETFESFRI